MKNILTLTAIVLIPFITLANTYSQIKELTDKIKTNSEAYRLICYGNRNTMTISYEVDIEITDLIHTQNATKFNKVK